MECAVLWIQYELSLHLPVVGWVYSLKLIYNSKTREIFVRNFLYSFSLSHPLDEFPEGDCWSGTICVMHIPIPLSKARPSYVHQHPQYTGKLCCQFLTHNSILKYGWP